MVRVCVRGAPEGPLPFSGKRDNGGLDTRQAVFEMVQHRAEGRAGLVRDLGRCGVGIAALDDAADRRFNQPRAGLAAFQRLERRCGGAAFLGLSAVRAGSKCFQRHLISLPFHKSNMIVFYRSFQATITLQTPMGTRSKGNCLPRTVKCRYGKEFDSTSTTWE